MTSTSWFYATTRHPEARAQVEEMGVRDGSAVVDICRAFLDLVLGHAVPRGRLPFDLPSFTQAVLDSRSDVAFDTADPLFRFGHGLSCR